MARTAKAHNPQALGRRRPDATAALHEELQHIQGLLRILLKFEVGRTRWQLALVREVQVQLEAAGKLPLYAREQSLARGDTMHAAYTLEALCKIIETTALPGTPGGEAV